MSFNPHRLKSQLGQATERLKLRQKKKESVNMQARREIATLLENGKGESARIRVEGVIREDYTVEAMELLTLHCDRLVARFGLIEQMRQCDTAIAESAYSIIYAVPRIDVKELGGIRDQLVAKYGKDFALNAMDNRNGCVDERLVHKLKFGVPDTFLVNRYLEEIAKTYKVDWQADDAEDGLAESLIDMGPPTKSDLYTALPAMDVLMPELTNVSVSTDQANTNKPETRQDAAASNMSADLPDIPKGPLGAAKKVDSPPPPVTSAEDPPHNGLPSPPPSKPASTAKPTAAPKKPGDDIPDLDELARRFEALKRR